jgi:hypothetical protein
MAAHDAVAGAPGKRAEIAFLALTALIVGADPAIDGNLSQLNPLAIELRKCRKYARFHPPNSFYRAIILSQPMPSIVAAPRAISEGLATSLPSCDVCLQLSLAQCSFHRGSCSARC